MIDWLKLTDEQRKTSLAQASRESGITIKALEKDWWVTLTLRALFQTKYADSLIFKGGTSLSKCWKLIERFSEDIDIAIDPELFGIVYKPEPGSAYLNKLKRKGCDFTSNELKTELEAEFVNLGLPKGTVTVTAGEIQPTMRDKDPQELYVKYVSLYDPNPYLADEVKIEVGVRAKLEPFSKVEVNSLLTEFFPNDAYTSVPFPVQAVEPRKTFLEKAFLLQEEFEKPDKERIRTDRMSRHYYDLEKMMDSGVCSDALADHKLYLAIVKHRSFYSKQKDFDYNKLLPGEIDFIPPAAYIDGYHKDYGIMRDNMIYGNSLEPKGLFERIAELKDRFRGIKLPD